MNIDINLKTIKVLVHDLSVQNAREKEYLQDILMHKSQCCGLDLNNLIIEQN